MGHRAKGIGHGVMKAEVGKWRAESSMPKWEVGMLKGGMPQGKWEAGMRN